MSQNPYHAPQPPMPDGDANDPDKAVTVPAVSLMVVAGIFLGLLLLSFGFNVILLASGLTEEMDQPFGMSKESQIIIRCVLGVVLMAINAYILYGAFNMLQLKNYSAARAAAIMAVIPCIGPCYILGIPFGIWALFVLGQPHVKNAFHE